MIRITLKQIREELPGYEKRQIKSPSLAVEVLHKYIDGSDREMMVVLCLNTKNHINAINTVSVGTLNSSLLHPREIFKPAILSNSASIILGHNHPSGITDPSDNDIRVTRRVAEAGEIMGISLLDHIIIGGDGNYTSLKEKGLVDTGN